MTVYLLQREGDNAWYCGHAPRHDWSAPVVFTSAVQAHARRFTFHSIADATALTLPGRWRTVPVDDPALGGSEQHQTHDGEVAP